MNQEPDPNKKKKRLYTVYRHHVTLSNANFYSALLEVSASVESPMWKLQTRRRTSTLSLFARIANPDRMGTIPFGVCCDISGRVKGLDGGRK